MKYPSRHACVEALRSMFVDPATDSLPLDDIYKAVGRDLSKTKLNLTWLQNKLTPLKHYGFVRPILTQRHPRRLHKVQLTAEGKKALESPSRTPLSTVTLESIASDIRAFERQNPSIECQLVVRLRGNASGKKPPVGPEAV